MSIEACIVDDISSIQNFCVELVKRNIHICRTFGFHIFAGRSTC